MLISSLTFRVYPCLLDFEDLEQVNVSEEFGFFTAEQDLYFFLLSKYIVILEAVLGSF